MTTEKNKPSQMVPISTMAARVSEFQVEVKEVFDAFLEIYPLYTNLSITGAVACLKDIGFNEADALAIWLCGVISGGDNEVIGQNGTSPVAVWDALMGMIGWGKGGCE